MSLDTWTSALWFAAAAAVFLGVAIFTLAIVDLWRHLDRKRNRKRHRYEDAVLLGRQQISTASLVRSAEVLAEIARVFTEKHFSSRYSGDEKTALEEGEKSLAEMVRELRRDVSA